MHDKHMLLLFRFSEEVASKKHPRSQGGLLAAANGMHACTRTAHGLPYRIIGCVRAQTKASRQQTANFFLPVLYYVYISARACVRLFPART